MTRTIRETQSVYWAFSPVHYVTRIFGLSPYSMEVQNNRARWSVSRFSLLYNTFFLIVVLFCILPLIEHIKYRVYVEKLDKLAMYSDLFRRINGMVIATICVTVSLMNRHRTCQLMKDMDGLDQDLTSYGIKMDYERMRKENIIMTLVAYFPLSTCVVVDSIVARTIGQKSTLYWCASILLFGVNFSTVFQFTGLVLVLRERFAILNKYFRTLNDQTNGKKLKISLTSQGTRQKKRTWKNFNSQVPSTNFSGYVTRVGAANATKYTTNPVSLVCDFYDRLCEWGKTLNSLYSIQILYTTGLASVVVVVHLYIFYLMLSKNEKYKLTFFDSWKPAAWGFWFFSMIFLMSYVCARTRDEANKTSVILHRINFDPNDEKSRTYVEIFSLQMLHQKLLFSAGGFFLVDFSSLRTVLASVTTYLVFFIQFEIAARNSRSGKTPP